MEVTFRPDKTVYIENARIIFRNFKGAPDRFNREGGKRTFNVVIPAEDIAEALSDNGWNVSIKPPREEGDTPLMNMKVNLRYNYGRGPFIAMYSGNRKVRVTEDMVDMLDSIDIDHVNMILRPYFWDETGHSPASAYLNSLEVFQRIDDIEARFAEEEAPVEDDEPPFALRR